MAPEQAAGDAVDHRADLYAWGVVAYEMLAGAHPFADRTTAAALIAAHICDPAPSLSTLRVDLSPALIATVERTLAKRPAERPASATELVQALDRVAASSGADRVRRPIRRQLATSAVVLLLVAAVAVPAIRRGPPSTDAPAAPVARTRSLAVLPFRNQSQDTADVYFAEGMSDELTTALGKISTVRVASRSSAARYRDASAREAARALRVEAVLEGTVRRVNDRIRVSAALTNAADGIEIWSDTYDRQASDVFVLQDDIARAIVSALRAALGGPAAARAGASPRGTSDLEAYDLYLKGRFSWSKRGREGLLGAAKFYERAIARDSMFARAHAGLAMAYTPMPLFGAAPADSVLPLAERSAERALAIDSTLSEAHLALANVLKMQWRWAEAEPHFRAAIEFSPSDATAHQWYGTYLYSLGRTDEAAAQLFQARDLDPVSAVLGTDVVYGLYAARRFDEALVEARRTVALDTTMALSHWLTGLALVALGRPDSAVQAFETVRRLGSPHEVRAALVAAYRAMGRTAEANAEYASLVQSYRRGQAQGYDMAVGAAASGDLTAAMAAVKRLIDQRESLVTEYSLPCDPLLDPLKSRPEFNRLLGGLGMRVCPAQPGR